ncbi:MAG: vancomycin resistance histidine kinase VanS [Firmicutes bacterium HGW-Firmicutes-16]|nr:MAG: vancomycin resistance histidine kinase VanS [Firmicutes bacterium HGW-Firmicutes-16]
MFLQTLIILVAAILIVLVLRSAGRGYVGNALTLLISKLRGVSWDEALGTYHYYIRNNLDTIMVATIVVFFVVLIRVALTWFTKYFDEIISGVDLLADESHNRIAMSPELGFVQEKLNQVKDTLACRAREAQEAEQRKNDLVVYLAHDIKTPLTSVIGYLTLIDETSDMPEEQKAKYVHITLDKAFRLESLINEFFEITRYNLQTIPLKKERIDLYYMLIQMADEAYPLLSANGKQAAIHANENMSVWGDSDKLARVFNNILKNAIAYGNAGSTIDISAETQGNAVLIRFENAGTIPQEKLGSIFEKFYRLDDARSTATGGAGLGLAIAKDIITLHGGSIGAEIQNGRTVFTITLPNNPQ